jgi:GNAT superfamily N-acetyltransferase
MTLAIRRAGAEDLPRVREIRHGVRENRLSDPSKVSDAEVRWYLDDAIFLISEDEAGVQGFACANTRTGLVWALFVDPAAEGRGHGGRLLDALCDGLAAAGLVQAHLTTDGGTRAAAFYERRGWRCTGRVFGGELAFVLPLT